MKSIMNLMVLLMMVTAASANAQLAQSKVNIGKYNLTNAYPVYDQGISYIKLRMEPADDKARGISQKNWIVFGADMLQAGGAAIGVLKWDPKQDKVRHAFAGYCAASFTHGALELVLPNNMKNRRWISAFAGMGASIVAGVAKEYWDSLGNGRVETLDAATTAGGGFGGAVVSAAIGGAISSLTLTINTDKILKKLPHKKKPQEMKDYSPF